MANLPEKMRYEGISVDCEFADPRPSFGDLFRICGDIHPQFPPTGAFGFDTLTDLQFDQVDDYFGVRGSSDEGDDVIVWLYPLVDGEPVHHHPGPLDGVRLAYNVLRNPIRHVEHYLHCLEGFAALSATVHHRSRGIRIGLPLDLSPVKQDIDAVVAYWAAEGVVVGSNDALELDY